MHHPLVLEHRAFHYVSKLLHGSELIECRLCQQLLQDSGYGFLVVIIIHSVDVPITLGAHFRGAHPLSAGTHAEIKGF